MPPAFGVGAPSTSSGGGGGGVADQGMPGALGAPWPVILSDGNAALGVVGNPLFVSFDESGLATEATLGDVEADLDAILVQLDVPLSGRAADRTTAAAPFSVQLSDGVAFYVALTDAQLRAAPVPVSFDESSLATEATLSAVGSVLVEIAGDTDALSHLDVDLSSRASDANLLALTAALVARVNVLGQQLAAASTSVVLASDQPAVPVSFDESGLATETTLAAAEADLDSILAQLDVALSTRASEATLAEIAGDTDKLDVALSTLATQSTLAEIAGDTDNLDVALSSRLNTLGQKLASASAPVVLASDQSVIPVTGPLTDTQLRAAAVPVSGPLTDTQLRASAVPVSGPLTDAQLRAAAVPVSGPLTDAQLRASAVPVSATSLPLPTGAASEATLAEIAIDTDNLANLDVALSTRASQATLASVLGQLDVALSTRAAEHVTALSPHAARLSDGAAFYKALTDTELRASAVPVSGPLTDAQLRAAAVPVSAASLPLPTGAATESTLQDVDSNLAQILQRQADDSQTTQLKGHDSNLSLASPSITGSTGAAWRNALDVQVRAQDSVGVLQPLGEMIDATSKPFVVGGYDGTAWHQALMHTDGAFKTIARGGAKGATTAADVTATAEGTDHQALDVQLYHGGAAKDPTAIRALTNADVVTAELSKWIGSTAPTVGSKTSASSIPVVVASDQTLSVSGTLSADDDDGDSQSISTRRVHGRYAVCTHDEKLLDAVETLTLVLLGTRDRLAKELQILVNLAASSR